MAIAEAAAKDVRKPRTSDNLTTRRLGYDPMSFDDGLRLLIPWLRETRTARSGGGLAGLGCHLPNLTNPVQITGIWPIGYSTRPDDSC